MDESIEDLVERGERGAHEDAGSLLVDEADNDAPIIKLVHSIVAQAIQQGASDIHVNPEEGDTKVLFRVDGVLAPAATVKRKMAAGVVSRIKIMADLDISERRVPQDGRFALTVDGRRVDIRVVTLAAGARRGRRAEDPRQERRRRRASSRWACRPPSSSASSRDQAPQRRRPGHRPDGLGQVDDAVRGAARRSTTASAASSRSRTPSSSGSPGVKQMQIAPKAGVTFDVGLRSMLRADPDVIMVGEIRDRETAHIAVEAALTGHLVLSTLHTRDAPSALGRLIDMGIEPFLVSSAVDCIVAQRLVRALCQHCKRPQNVPESVLAEHGLAGAEPYEPVGCSRCSGSGYRGRVGLYEVMTVSERIRALILEHASVDDMVAVAAERRHAASARRRHAEGPAKALTSIAEVERMTTSLL